jgi:choline kinase
VLAAGRSERLASVTGGGSTALLRLGGLSLVERAVRSLLAAGLQRVVVVVDHDAGRRCCIWPEGAVSG